MLMPLITIEPLTVTVPCEAVVNPGAELVVEGADQPLGTTRVRLPSTIPPVLAVYVKVSVLPVLDCVTEVGRTDSVPEPSGDSTASEGEEARSTGVPEARLFCFVVHVCAPGLVGAVAPVPPPDLAP